LRGPGKEQELAQALLGDDEGSNFQRLSDRIRENHLPEGAGDGDFVPFSGAQPLSAIHGGFLRNDVGEGS